MLILVSHASCSQELQVLQCALQLATCTVQTLAASTMSSILSNNKQFLLDVQLIARVQSCCVATSAV